MRKQLKSEETMQSPKVFASYSHDSDEHKEWVLQLCTKLVENGIDVILDQWNLGAGDDLTLFVEKGVRDSDRVLVICTDTYVRKANAGEGGVGYERLIVTAQLAQDLGTNKFIPIIRQSSADEKTPTFLATRVYIDFTDDSEFDEKVNELLHEIHNVPIIRKPRLGKNPLPNQPSEPEDLSHNLPEIPDKIESVDDAYESAFELARAEDILGWSKLVRRIRQDIFKSLVQWRQEELDGQRAENIEQLHQKMDKAVNFVAPLISMALVGVESRNEHFKNQESLLDDLLNIQSMEGWNRTGHVPWIEIPYALGYVYQSLHGSLCLQTDQLDLAFSLAQAKFPLAMDSQFTRSLWENRQLMGYCESLGNQRIESWKYLVNAYERWEWLSHIFANDVEYRTSLVAYYMALSMHELAVEIATGREIGSNPFNSVNVPFDFLYEKYEIKQRATSLLLHDSALPELWTCIGVTQDQMKDSWETWVELYKTLFWRTNQGSSNFQVFVTSPPQYLNFFDAL